MSFRNSVRPITMFMVAGLLLPAVSQAQSGSTSLPSAPNSSVIVLPSDGTSDNNDPNFDLFGDFNREVTAPLGTQAVTSLLRTPSSASALTPGAIFANSVESHGLPPVINFGPVGSTPEPGAFALLGSMGLMLTAVKMRRRKH